MELHNSLTKQNINELKTVFENAPDGMLTAQEFREALEDIAHIYYNLNEYTAFYMKMDTNGTNSLISWEMFLAYIIFGFQEGSTKESRLEPPVTGLSKILKTHHRHPVQRIIFMPEIDKNRVPNYLYGCYLTMSKDGVINYWSLDMEKERSVQSTCPFLKVQSTWILDIVSLPDINVICTSSTERDLRFYDTSAKKFQLRIMITSFRNAVVTMHYTFYQSLEKDCKLLLGDSHGCVKLITFNPKDRGPFQSKTGNPLISLRYSEFARGVLESMQIKDIEISHSDWVRQLNYFENYNYIVSVAACSKVSMAIQTVKDGGQKYIFKVLKGFLCFSVAEDINLIATGGSDCMVRIWNPVVTSRAISVLRGHHECIVSVVFQDKGNILCSVSKDKCIKVWSVANQCCIQTFKNLPSSLGERTPLCTFYNPNSREVFVASMKIVVFQLNALLNPEYTDGSTHTKEVSVVLYNSLFQYVVSCGYDSYIIVWEPWTGRRIRVIKEAHFIIKQGEKLFIEITAATFDPTQHLLITGATDGTLKMWNFNTGICIKNLSISPTGEIFTIIWLHSRILVMGENRIVTEFADSKDVGETSFKSWSSRHSDDIICAAVRSPQTIVTASDNGELIFWHLETGQAYGMYNVRKPRERQQMVYDTNKREETKTPRSTLSNKSHKTHKMKKSLPSKMIIESTKQIEHIQPTKQRVESAIHAVLFFASRPMKHDVGSLLVSMETGDIQMWSHHPAGGYLESFRAVHVLKDYCITMITDEENNYFFTGHMAGYIKIWSTINFGIPEHQHKHICMPELRLIFPFLGKDLIPGRAKRACKNIKHPLLLSSYQAHLKPVLSLSYINTSKILLSCSSDCSVRLWTLGGQYLGTLGTFKKWTPLIPNMFINTFADDREYEFPVDIKRSCSHTTFMVLSKRKYNRPLTKKQKKAEMKTIMTEIKGVYGERTELQNTIGKHFKLPERSKHRTEINLVKTVQQLSIYNQIDLVDFNTDEPRLQFLDIFKNM